MSTPSSMEYSFRKLRIIRPAPVRSTSVSVSSAITIADVRRRALAPPELPRAPFLEDLVDVGPRHLQRGREPEQDAGRQADEGHETEDREVHRELDPVRLADVRDGGVEQPDADVRQREAEQSAETREQRALDEQLPDDPGAAGAERRRGRPPRARACVERASSRFATFAQAMRSTKPTAPISARKTVRMRAAVEAFVERHHGRVEILVRVGVLLPEAGGDAGHLRLRGRSRRARCESAEHAERANVALGQQIVLGDERSPHVGVGGESHALRHDADDYGRDVVDLDRLAENRRVACVSVLPDRVAEDDDRRRFRTVFPGREVAAQERWLTQQLERVRRDARAGESFGGAAGLADVHRRRREDAPCLETRAPGRASPRNRGRRRCGRLQWRCSAPLR